MAALSGLHLLAVSALWLAALPVDLQVPGTAAMLLSLWHHRRPRAPRVLRCHNDGKLETRTGDDWVVLSLEKPLVSLPWLTVIRYRQPPAKRPATLVIAPGALPAEDFRRLRVWLRWLGTHALPSPEGQP